MEIDQLTGLRNRDALRLAVNSILQATHNDFSLSVLCIGIDNMKHFNMHNGHEVGDSLIAKIGSLVDRRAGSNRTYRSAGDQFTAVLEACNQSEAARTSEEILNSIRADPPIRQVENCGDKGCMGPADISVSIGMVTKSNLAGIEVDSLMLEAYDRMIDAKCAGRNCVK